MESSHGSQSNSIHQRGKEVWRMVEVVGLPNRPVNGSGSHPVQPNGHDYGRSFGSDSLPSQPAANQHILDNRTNSSRMQPREFSNRRANNRMFNSHYGGSENSSDSEIIEKNHLENGSDSVPIPSSNLIQPHIAHQQHYSQNYQQQGKNPQQQPSLPHFQRSNYQNNQFPQRFHHQSQQINPQRQLQQIPPQQHRIQHYQPKSQQQLQHQQQHQHQLHQQHQEQHQEQQLQQQQQSLNQQRNNHFRNQLPNQLILQHSNQELIPQSHSSQLQQQRLDYSESEEIEKKKSEDEEEEEEEEEKEEEEEALRSQQDFGKKQETILNEQLSVSSNDSDQKIQTEENSTVADNAAEDASSPNKKDENAVNDSPSNDTSVVLEGSEESLRKMVNEAMVRREKACSEEVEIKAKLIAMVEIEKIRSTFEREKQACSEVETNLKSQLDALNERCKEKEEIVLQLQQQAKTLEGELIENKEKMKERVWQEGQLREKNSELLQIRLERDNALADKQMQFDRHEVDRAELASQLAQLKQEMESKDQQLIDIKEQMRQAREEIWNKDEQLRESQMFYAHYQEMEMHLNSFSASNQSLQMEVRDRIAQYNHLYDAHHQLRQQYEGGGNFNIQLIQQLQKENYELKEQLHRYIPSSSSSSSSTESKSFSSQSRNMSIMSNDSSHKQLNHLLPNIGNRAELDREIQSGRLSVSPVLPLLPPNPIHSPFAIPQPVVIPPLPPIASALQLPQSLLPSQLPPAIPLQQQQQSLPIFRPVQNASQNQHINGGKNAFKGGEYPQQHHQIQHHQNQHQQQSLHPNSQKNFVRTTQSPIQPPIHPPQHTHHQSNPKNESVPHHPNHQHQEQLPSQHQLPSQQQQHLIQDEEVHPPTQPNQSIHSSSSTHFSEELSPEILSKDSLIGVPDVLTEIMFQEKKTEIVDPLLPPEPRQLQHQQGISAGMEHINANSKHYSNSSPSLTKPTASEQTYSQNLKQEEVLPEQEESQSFLSNSRSFSPHTPPQQPESLLSSPNKKKVTLLSSIESSMDQSSEDSPANDSNTHDEMHYKGVGRGEGEGEGKGERNSINENSIPLPHSLPSTIRLMDEHSLLTCLVRTLAAEPSKKVHISTTVAKRLSKLLDPLEWKDYENHYGHLQAFISHHPELFVLVDGAHVHLREGARAYLASTKVSSMAPPFSSSFSSNDSNTPRGLLAVTPMASHPSTRQQKQKTQNQSNKQVQTIEGIVSSIPRLSSPSDSTLDATSSHTAQERKEHSNNNGFASAKSSGGNNVEMIGLEYEDSTFFSSHA